VSGSPVVITLASIFLTMTLSVLIAEAAGYFLHRLMHSERIPSLSRAHLIHHLLMYGPRQPMRTDEYLDATDGRAALGNIGLEWLVPSALILGFCWSVMWFAGVPLVYRLLAICTLIGWPIFMFSYLHDRMHLRGFWMERAPLLGSWFRAARRLHDIHHRSIDESGRMDRNFGIGFFFFDRVFRTLAKRHFPFNWHGYKAAVRRARLEQDLTDEYSRFPSEFHF
jgi:sterol desaturase/sphingolipid hydroxylase (fatty acid hydroxylase superfamily)